MTHYHSVGFLILLSCCLLEAFPRPINNEDMTTASIDTVTETETIIPNKEERSLMYEESNESEGNARDIIEKIRAINDAVKRPQKRPQINWNVQPQTGGGYIMDKDVLEKLQQIIALGKINSYPDGLVSQDNNLIPDYIDLRQSRHASPLMQSSQTLSMMPAPYLTSMPVLVMPVPTNSPTYDMNPLKQLTRQEGQGPSSPFGQFQWPFGQFQWPFAQLFPILIRDPLQSIMNGGGWSHFIESGQSADICRRQKSPEDAENNLIDENELETKILKAAINRVRSRKGRAIKKRTVSHESRAQNVENTKIIKTIFGSKKPAVPTTTPKPAKPLKQKFISQSTHTDADEGDLRFPFSTNNEFTWFGNRKPIAPQGPGFFINRLKVRRGGVAIAGPGGVATAGRGGTAIVGPGGLAYTQPGGLAVAGPAARVVALAPEADLASIVSRLQEHNGSVARSLQAIPEGKVVATGPIIYYHPYNKYQLGGIEGRRRFDEYQYDGMRFAKGHLKTGKPDFMIFVKPTAYARSPKGVAIANPISNVVIAQNKTGSIVHSPAAVAVVGPGGIAHAQADLYLYEFVPVTLT